MASMKNPGSKHLKTRDRDADDLPNSTLWERRFLLRCFRQLLQQWSVNRQQWSPAANKARTAQSSTLWLCCVAVLWVKLWDCVLSPGYDRCLMFVVVLDWLHAPTGRVVQHPTGPNPGWTQHRIHTKPGPYGLCPVPPETTTFATFTLLGSDSSFCFVKSPEQGRQWSWSGTIGTEEESAG